MTATSWRCAVSRTTSLRYVVGTMTTAWRRRDAPTTTVARQCIATTRTAWRCGIVFMTTLLRYGVAAMTSSTRRNGVAITTTTARRLRDVSVTTSTTTTTTATTTACHYPRLAFLTCTLSCCLLSALAAGETAAGKSPLVARGTLKTARVDNVVQCRRLCWYFQPCARYSYYQGTGDDSSCRRSDTTDNSCDKGDNCVLHAASQEDGVGGGGGSSEGWDGGLASPDHLPLDHACADRPCGEREMCVPFAGRQAKACVPVSSNADIDECASSPCQNGGTCVDHVNAYTCNCTAGFNGTHCQTDIDECASSPCQNGGVCEDQVNAYTCNCTSGYAGNNCESITLTFSSLAVGAAGVWAVSDDLDEVFYMEGSRGQPQLTSHNWLKVTAASQNLKQLDVGPDIVWGLDGGDRIYYRSGISSGGPTGQSWQKVNGALRHISVGTDGVVWGSNSGQNVYRLPGIIALDAQGSVDWEDYFERQLVQISVGDNGIWALDSTRTLFVREGVDANNIGGTSWRPVEGPSLSVVTSVSSGSSYTLVVDENGAVYYKAGVDQSPFLQVVPPAPPSGLSGRVKMVDSAGEDSIYGVTTSGELFRLLLTPLASGSGSGSGFESTVVPLVAMFR